MCNFIKASLNDLSKNLNDKDKIITKEHFSNKFKLLNEKVCFPYEFITKENIYNENLPAIENFYSSLKLDNISEEDYDKILEIYKKLNCKNIKEYLDIYLKLDICCKLIYLIYLEILFGINLKLIVVNILQVVHCHWI